MSKLKKVVAAIMATATVGALSISAFAVDYNNYEFDFVIKSNSYDFSDATAKQDDLNYAMARCKYGSVSTTKPVKLSVYRSKVHSSTYCVSDIVYATEASETDTTVNYQIDYTKVRANGSVNYLCGEAENYDVSIGGKWDP